jgi:hypothetical protein
MYLSGQVGIVLARPHPNLGVMANPRSLGAGQVAEIVRQGIPWAADNDAFTNFDEGRWLTWLETMPEAARALCLFAAAPDVVGDAEATLARSSGYLSAIRAMGYPVAYVAQDGFDPSVVPWDAVDWLFIGGTTAFKRGEAGGYAAISEGKRRGKRVHVGRVNGGGFLRQLAAAGADTADGTKLCFGPDTNYRLVTGWLDGLAAQPPMTLEAVG